MDYNIEKNLVELPEPLGEEREMKLDDNNNQIRYVDPDGVTYSI